MQRDADDPRSLLAWLELNFSDWYSQLEVQSKNPNAFLFNIQFLLLFSLNFFRSFLYKYLRVIHFRIADVCFVARRAQQAQCPLPAGHSTKTRSSTGLKKGQRRVAKGSERKRKPAKAREGRRRELTGREGQKKTHMGVDWENVVRAEWKGTEGNQSLGKGIF